MLQCHNPISLTLLARVSLPILSPLPPTFLSPAGTVDIAVIIGVVVTVVIVILLIILAVFIIVLVYMKRRDTSEPRGSRRLEATGLERGGVENAVMSCSIYTYNSECLLVCLR